MLKLDSHHAEGCHDCLHAGQLDLSSFVREVPTKERCGRPPKQAFRRNHVFITLVAQPGPHREYASSFAITRDIIRRFFRYDLDQLQENAVQGQAANEMSALVKRPASSNYEFSSRLTSAASHTSSKTSNVGHAWTEKDFSGCLMSPDMVDASQCADQPQELGGRTENSVQRSHQVVPSQVMRLDRDRIRDRRKALMASVASSPSTNGWVDELGTRSTTDSPTPVAALNTTVTEQSPSKGLQHDVASSADVEQQGQCTDEECLRARMVQDVRIQQEHDCSQNHELNDQLPDAETQIRYRAEVAGTILENESDRSPSQITFALIRKASSHGLKLGTLGFQLASPNEKVMFSSLIKWRTLCLVPMNNRILLQMLQQRLAGKIEERRRQED
ncbi:hypothetical protein MaudMau93_000897 [Microsporum audouinii]